MGVTVKSQGPGGKILVRVIDCVLVCLWVLMGYNKLSYMSYTWIITKILIQKDHVETVQCNFYFKMHDVFCLLLFGEKSCIDTLLMTTFMCKTFLRKWII